MTERRLSRGWWLFTAWAAGSLVAGAGCGDGAAVGGAGGAGGPGGADVVDECASEADCAGDEVCVNGTCAPPGCANGETDGSETDVDCGGDCPACGEGASCGEDDDCASGLCAGGTCVPPSCGDGEIGDGEVCDDGGESATCDADCTEAECGDGVLNAAAGEACDDGDGNDDEAADACRTSCLLPVCGDGGVDTGEECDDANDVNDDECTNDCKLPSCDDGIVNQDESDVDCGGAVCSACSIGKTCATGADCASGVCGGDGKCAAPTCNDGVQNQDETDVDCGGVACGKTCGTGKNCAGAGDCRGKGICDTDTNTCRISEIIVSALSTARNGNLGGLDSADALCAAEAAQYNKDGVWVALLASSNPMRTFDSLFNGKDRTVPVKLIDGSAASASWNTFMSNGTFSSVPRAFNNNLIDEPYGNWDDADAWTGSSPSGGLQSGLTCNDWTSTSGTGRCTELDLSPSLFGTEDRACSLTLAVLCVRIAD